MKHKNNIKYYAQELNSNTYNLTRMNLVMRGILPDNIITRNADTLQDDWPFFDDKDPVNTYNPLYVDAVVSNPPYSQPWDSTDKESDPRYARFGIAPKSKADYAFLLHDLFHVKTDGIMTIVLPHGVLFRGGEEGQIRKNLIEYNHIDTIIGLPANIFYGTGIPTIIMVLKQKRDHTDTLFIDASRGFIKEGKNNKLRASDIKRIVDTINNRSSIENFSRIVSREELRENEYNLNIPRYIDSSEKAESWDLHASLYGGIPESELQALEKYWRALPNLKDSLFEAVNNAYSTLRADNLSESIQNHSDVQAFKSRFTEAFDDFGAYLKQQLVDNLLQVNIHSEKERISDNIFSRLENSTLIDPYIAYQLLDDEWAQIEGDIETIQTEGLSSIQQVDPLYVTRKRAGKDEEVQDGWTGHILPFDLVQKHLLQDELAELEEKQNRLAEISSDVEELFSELTEEEKEGSYLNEEKDAFLASELKKEIKSNTLEVETLEKLKAADSLFTEEKALKAQIKKDEADLHNLTKVTIEELNDEAALKLLQKKWINPLIDGLQSLPIQAIDELVAQINKISKKYNTTLSEIELEIKETEAELVNMLDDLVGNEYDMLGIKELKNLLGGV